MPKVIFLMKWDARRGLHIVGQYPPDYELDKDMLLDFFGLALSRGDAKSFSELEHRGERLVLYFTGITTKMAFGAIVKKGEDLGLVRGAMVRSVIDIIVKQELPTDIGGWKLLFDKISKYHEMTNEEKVGELFGDEFFSKVYEKIIDFGLIAYDELLEELGILTGTTEEDILRAYLEVMASLGIIQLHYDDETMKEYIYLLRDVIIVRKKPEMFDTISSTIDGYPEDYQQWVDEYMESKKWKEEKRDLATIFANPQIYSALKNMRKRGILPKGKIREIERVGLDYLIFIDVCRTNDKYIYMFTDVGVVLMFPRYSIHKCLERYASGILDKRIAKKYLETIKKSYL